MFYFLNTGLVKSVLTNLAVLFRMNNNEHYLDKQGDRTMNDVDKSMPLRHGQKKRVQRRVDRTDNCGLNGGLNGGLCVSCHKESKWRSLKSQCWKCAKASIRDRQPPYIGFEVMRGY